MNELEKTAVSVLIWETFKSFRSNNFEPIVGDFSWNTPLNVIKFVQRFYQRCSIVFLEIKPKAEFLADCLKIFWRAWVFIKMGRTQSLHFWPVSPWRWPKSKKMYIHLERLQSLGYLSMLKSSFYLLSPFREECDYFLCYLGYFWQKAGRDHKLKNQNQNVTYPILLIRFQTKKLVYRFLIALFHFETHFVQCFTFFRIFWTVGEFVTSRNQEISLIKIRKISVHRTRFKGTFLLYPVKI